jgi:hypothetical protein
VKKIVLMCLMYAGVALIIAPASANPPGKFVVYAAPNGRVTFDGTTHAAAGLRCQDCHTKIFR